MSRTTLTLAVAISAVLLAGIVWMLLPTGEGSDTRVAGTRSAHGTSVGAPAPPPPVSPASRRSTEPVPASLPGFPEPEDGRPAPAPDAQHLHLSGVVREDPSGQPVKSFVVTLEPRDPAKRDSLGKRWKKGVPFRSPEGRFRSAVALLEAGQTYRVEVLAPGYLPFVAESWAPVERGLEANLLTAAGLSGRALWAADRRAVTGATVRVLDASQPALVLTTQQTDAEGRFAVTTVADRSVLVEIDHTEGLVLRHGPVVLTSAAPLEIGELLIGAAARVSVQVRLPDGGPGARLDVRLRMLPGTDPTAAVLFEKQARTDEQGRLSFGRVPPGVAWLAVAEPDGSWRAMRPESVAAGSHPNFKITLHPRACQLTGVVDTSRAVTSMVTLVLSSRLEDGTYAELGRQEVATPGRYEFPDLEPGAYRIEGSLVLKGRRFAGSRELTLEHGCPPVNLTIQLDS